MRCRLRSLRAQARLARPPSPALTRQCSVRNWKLPRPRLGLAHFHRIKSRAPEYHAPAPRGRTANVGWLGRNKSIRTTAGRLNASFRYSRPSRTDHRLAALRIDREAEAANSSTNRSATRNPTAAEAAMGTGVASCSEPSLSRVEPFTGKSTSVTAELNLHPCRAALQHQRCHAWNSRKSST
jgi:hypothetical protein